MEKKSKNARHMKKIKIWEKNEKKRWKFGKKENLRKIKKWSFEKKGEEWKFEKNHKKWKLEKKWKKMMKIWEK